MILESSEQIAAGRRRSPRPTVTQDAIVILLIARPALCGLPLAGSYLDRRGDPDRRVFHPRASRDSAPAPGLVRWNGGRSLLIERASARRTVTPIWLAIPYVVLWSNFHAECVFGVLLIGIFAAAELLRPSVLTRRDAALAVLIALAGFVATMASPYGWGLFRYLYENWRLPRLASIAELLPPPIPTYPAFYVYLVACAALVVWRRRDLRLWEVIAVGVFAMLGLQYLRLTPLVLFASAPFVAARLATSARRIDPRLILAVAFCTGIAVSRVPIPVLLGQLAAGSRAVEPKAFFSADAIAFIRQAGLEGRVFNSYNLGGYLAWMLYPRVQIFQDSRTQAYPREHFISILVASYSPPDWEIVAADVDWAVLSVARPNQLSGVGNFPPGEWATVFADEAIEILVRRRGRFGKLAGVDARGPIG